MLSFLITTNRRPDILSRALFSYASVPAFQGIPLTVFDDFPEPELQKANADVAASAGRENGFEIRVVSRRERAELLRRFELEAAASAQALRFSLEGIPQSRLASHGGPNRNAALLFNAGRKTVSADDDTVRRFRKLREAAVGGRNAKDEGLPLFFAAAAGGSRLENLSEEYRDDPFAAFEGVLGKTSREIGADSRLSGGVRLAMAGIYGGRWFSSPFAIFDTDPSLHSLMWGDAGEYLEARRDPVSLLSAQGIRLTDRYFFVTTFFGWDGREPLPPFFPHIRNHDGVWGFLVRCCYPDSPICHLPFAVEHDLSLHRPFTDENFFDFASDSGNIIILILHFFYRSLRAETASAVMAGLGSRLISCTGLSRRDWRRFVTELHLAGEGKRLERLESRLAASGGRPEYWAADVERHLKALKRAALSCEPYLPREFLPCGRDAEAVFRDYLLRCGVLLAAWPEIWLRASEMGGTGGV